MESIRPFTNNFKQYAFKWKAEFGQRHEGVYGLPQEADRYVERQVSATKEDMIDTFVSTQCQRDFDRYLYRTDLLAGFLESADLGFIRGDGDVVEISTARALIDDRNDASGARNNIAGNRRRPLGALDSRGLYNELLRAVSNCTSSCHV